MLDKRKLGVVLKKMYIYSTTAKNIISGAVMNFSQKTTAIQMARLVAAIAVEEAQVVGGSVSLEHNRLIEP
ncbi:MAG: hypothetical protein N2Z58_04915 [Fervidobacterium sp.]|nr:hypothetical protein [Fervidobacterium sp.]